MIHSNVLTVQERFWSKVDFNGPVPEGRPLLGPCHVWIGSLAIRGGYGQFRLDGRVRKAHQVYAKAKLALADIHARLAVCPINNQPTERI